MSESKTLKLGYFDIPGRAESIRLAFAIGKVAFEEERFSFKDWGEKIKATTPWGGAPVLTLPSGEQIGQCRAISRFAGKKSGLYPTDEVLALKVDEIMDACEDLQSAVNKVGQGKEKKVKEAERKAAMLTGSPSKMLKKFEEIAKAGEPGFMVGKSLTMADIFIFCYTSMIIKSGFFDGVPNDLLKDFPALVAVRKSVISHPQVIARYAGEKSKNPLFALFKNFKD
mmetsp:Transcript_16224/g.24464  ORF Transcript_16224/g.24464 Transcript_16224/m.24464 type:complete len:226 (+) Transcript_16224:106-783(+)|eukprot:CAMPEP_0167758324 /NCGR_PEP_ID=MMETSP0110_2-20121227/10407_1 /TAXON_ID=629695 /ORGANISM="Gymnochlora sp., Strain CCMP2014" /LENGTH=225 /DNA_ID=CAMNT_0007644591 /DNA_START=48 /DNA_END=725 /DNA_ORIENTATION=-